MCTSRRQLRTAPSTPLQHSRSAEQLFTTHLPVIQRVITAVVRRHRLSSSDAEEFRSTVFLRLIECDYRILRAFQHRSSMRTFLNVVIERLYLDFRNHLWGKWRPSARARRHGPVALMLERLTERDGFTFAEAVEILRMQHGVTLPLAALSGLAADLRVRPRHGGDENMAMDMPDNRPLPDELMARSESAHRAIAARRALARAIKELEPGDRRLIELRFVEGLTVADIARELALDQKKLYRRLAQLLAALRRSLEQDDAVAELARGLANERMIDLEAPLRAQFDAKVA